MSLNGDSGRKLEGRCRRSRGSVKTVQCVASAGADRALWCAVIIGASHMIGAKKIRLLGIAAFAALAGCAAVRPSVVPNGDAYQLSVSGARWESQADTNLKALTAANDYCAEQGKHLMFRESTESGDHSWEPKREDLTFVCMDAKDPGYMRASVQRDPAVIASQ